MGDAEIDRLLDIRARARIARSVLDIWERSLTRPDAAAWSAGYACTLRRQIAAIDRLAGDSVSHGDMMARTHGEWSTEAADFLVSELPASRGARG